MSNQVRDEIAIILAAGYGRRLSDAHDGPKVLLDFEGRTLLARRLETLEACGVGEVSISVGLRRPHTRRG